MMRCQFCGSPNLRTSEYACLNGLFGDVSSLFAEDKVAIRCVDCRRFVIEDNEVWTLARQLASEIVKPDRQPMHVFNVCYPVLSVKTDGTEVAFVSESVFLHRTFKLWETLKWPETISQSQSMKLANGKWRRLWRRHLDPARDAFVFQVQAS